MQDVGGFDDDQEDDDLPDWVIVGGVGGAQRPPPIQEDSEAPPPVPARRTAWSTAASEEAPSPASDRIKPYVDLSEPVKPPRGARKKSEENIYDIANARESRVPEVRQGHCSSKQ